MVLGPVDCYRHFYNAQLELQVFWLSGCRDQRSNDSDNNKNEKWSKFEDKRYEDIPIFPS